LSVNTSLIVTNTNLFLKSGAFGYGLAIALASAFDAFTVLTVTFKCLFGIGYIGRAAGSLTIGFSMFHNTLGLTVFGVYYVKLLVVSFFG